MICTRCGLWAVLVGLTIMMGGFAARAQADDYAVAALKEASPSDGVGKEILDQLAPEGLRVSKGSTPYCDIWICKQWPVKADFQPSGDIKFPFEPGTLMGLIRFPKKVQDYRNQEIKPGVYTLRSALQPVDGNHVGTADSRDFFVIVKVSDDTSAAPMEEKNMFKLSAKAAGGTHPSMWYIRGPADTGELPAMKHDEDNDRWSVVFAGTPKGGAAGSMPVELNVVGGVKE